MQKFFLCFHLCHFKEHYLPLLSALILNRQKIIDYSMLRIFMCRILGTWKLKPLMKTIHSVTYLTLLFNYQRPFAWVIFRNVNNLICIWNKSIYKLKCKRKILLDFDGMIYKMVLVFFLPIKIQFIHTKYWVIRVKFILFYIIHHFWIHF